MLALFAAFVRLATGCICRLLFGRTTSAFAALLANAGIELRPLLALCGFTAFLADLGVEIGAEFLFDGLAALLANAGIELGAVLLTYRLAAVFGFVGPRFRPTFVRRHRSHLSSFA